MMQIPLWAASRETHGVALPARHSVAVLIGSYPELKALTVEQLAQVLARSIGDVQAGLAALCLDAFGDGALLEPGASFDACQILNGAPSAPVWMARAENASGYATFSRPVAR